MAYKIVMPQLGLTMEEGSVSSWLKAPGDWVEKGDPLFIVETDKIEMGKGYLGTIQVENGLKVPVGTLLAMLTDERETAA